MNLAKLLLVLFATGAGFPEFEYHEIDRIGNLMGQTSLVDVDRDGKLDWVVGCSHGDLWWFQYQSPDRWIRRAIGGKVGTEVGGAAFDVDGDGWVDQVSGNTWFRNPGNPAGKEFARYSNGAIGNAHDVVVADVDGDGKPDVVMMQDSAGVYWYKAPADPTKPWEAYQIGPAVHGGIAPRGVGDIDGDGDADVVRSTGWYENADGKGSQWTWHENIPGGHGGRFKDTTRAWIVDLNGDGRNDVVMTDCDTEVGPRRARWFENRDGKGGDWAQHPIATDKGDLHTLAVADFDGDGDPDVFSGEGPLGGTGLEGKRRWFVWENLDGHGGRWKEHVVLEGPECHEAVAADVDGDGDVDICSKPWKGDLHVYLKNMHIERGGTGPQANLLANPSFEQVTENSPLPAGWNGDREVYSRDAKAGRDGAAALRFVNHDPARYRLATQSVPLMPGRRYRFGGWVKTKDLAGGDSGATFCVEWADKDGKWLGGEYPGGVKGARDWTQIVGVTAVPEDAGSCTFSCYVREGMTGTAWFDAVEAVRVVEPPLRSVLTSPVYRGRLAADGQTVIRALARVDLRDCDVPVEQLVVRAALSDAEGKPLGQIERRPEVRQGSVEPIALEFPAEKLAPGRYRLEVALVGPGGKTIQTIGHELTRVSDAFRPKCTIDRHRRLLVDGQPFFPLGMYWSGIDEVDLRTYAQSKFNCLMPYDSPNREQMDLAEKHRLKVIYSVKDWYAGSEWCPESIRTTADEEPMVRGRVREFRDHPALLAWYLNDELPQQFLPQLEAHQRWVAEEDPNHPTWVVLYQVGQVAAYINTFDVIGTDPYPIGRKPASMAAEWTAETFRQVDRARPMWQVPQLHNWANYAGNEAEKKQGRTPTTEEIRSMAWQCIAEGATGLVFYSWFDLKRNPDVKFDRQWDGLKRVAAEIDRMTPVLLSVESVPEIVTDEGKPPRWLHSLVRRQGGKTYVIAVNDGDGEGIVSFRLPSAPRAIREIGENRSIEPSGNVFRDRIARLGVHAYEIE